MKKIVSVIVILLLGSSFIKKESASAIVIDIQPLGDIPKQTVDFVSSELKKIYPNIQIKKSIPLPISAFYEGRKRYRADSLIHFLHRQTIIGHVTIGLTKKDISTTKDEIKDYGIMGLGYCPGNACVASTFRLLKKDVLVQLFKTSIHELGHTQGLPHCPNKTCFMRDAEGKNHTNEEKEFCPKCKAVLESKGWDLN